MIQLAPSIIAANFARLGEQVEAALVAGVRRIHVDVMDGQFVPNITIGPLVLEALRPLAASYGAELDTHLMIVQPERYLAEFKAAGSDIINVHVETCPHLHRSVQQIRELGAGVGVAINPATPLTLLDDILADIDQVLVMTVNPGFGGQRLIPAAVAKIARLRAMLDARGLERVTIEVDGGVSVETIAALARAGITHAVAGSAIFNAQASIGENIDGLLRAAQVP
ncbi:ribulose-phosphate 3-epimerase [Candidatus Gracilibacteria bacterium]|nr:ribulose-phosphate 3-epimerase [Candidatus Gracilibacteria bacterium]